SIPRSRARSSRSTRTARGRGAASSTGASLPKRLDLPDGRWLIVIAGSNGSGKSTFFDLFLRPRGLRFVNPALIAAGLGSDDPAAVGYRAAELADIERRALIARGDTFVMETVLSDPHGAKLGLLNLAKKNGYHIAFLFIGIAGPELSSARVA